MTLHAPQVQVIIVAFNSAKYLQRCIDALEKQTFADFDILVWDNASTDGAVDRLRTGRPIQIERSPVNLGFAAANNRAAAHSRSAFIALLNPDAFPEPEWLARLVEAAKTYGAEAVASLQLNDADPSLLDGAGDCMSVAGFAWRGGYGRARTLAPAEPCEVFSACGAAALYSRAAFEALRGFEERFFCYCEDVDLGFRLRLLGGRCVLEPRAVVRHVGGGSSEQITNFALRYGARNRIWTLIRCMPLVVMPIALPAHVLVTAAQLIVAANRQTRPVLISAIGEALRGCGPFLADRRGLKPHALTKLIRALSWRPFTLLRSKVAIRPIDIPQGSSGTGST